MAVITLYSIYNKKNRIERLYEFNDSIHEKNAKEFISESIDKNKYTKISDGFFEVEMNHFLEFMVRKKNNPDYIYKVPKDIDQKTSDLLKKCYPFVKFVFFPLLIAGWYIGIGLLVIRDILPSHLRIILGICYGVTVISGIVLAFSIFSEKKKSRTKAFPKNEPRM